MGDVLPVAAFALFSGQCTAVIMMPAVLSPVAQHSGGAAEVLLRWSRSGWLHFVAMMEPPTAEQPAMCCRCDGAAWHVVLDTIAAQVHWLMVSCMCLY
jgi:hypothetical protein